MASTKDYKDYILEQLRILKAITCRPMMGEYIIYFNGVVVGGIYDDRLLVKKVSSNEKYNMEDAIPYPKGKAMYLVDDVDNEEQLCNIIIDTYEGL